MALTRKTKAATETENVPKCWKLADTYHKESYLKNVQRIK